MRQKQRVVRSHTDSYGVERSVTSRTFCAPSRTFCAPSRTSFGRPRNAPLCTRLLPLRHVCSYALLRMVLCGHPMRPSAPRPFPPSHPSARASLPPFSPLRLSHLSIPPPLFRFTPMPIRAPPAVPPQPAPGYRVEKSADVVRRKYSATRGSFSNRVFVPGNVGGRRGACGLVRRTRQA